MLCLSRKVDESLVFQTSDGPIRVTVLEPNRGKTRLGIDAPKAVHIWRAELYEEIRKAVERQG